MMPSPRSISYILFFGLLWSSVSTTSLSEDLKTTISISQVSTEHEQARLLQTIANISSAVDTEAARITNGSISNDSQRAAATCAVTKLIFPSQIHFPSGLQYQVEKDLNWSESCWLPAACFVRPRTTLELALLMKIVTSLEGRFAVRSGGHSPNPGFASVDSSGVLIDLQELKFLALDESGTLQAGPGNRWGDLWDLAESNNRSVAGARDRTVGISGCLLGGGMSYFPSVFGMAVDSVTNFEVVLANSTVINSNVEDNAALFRALKGGGSNFGIISRFDIQTHPLIHAQYSLDTYNASDYANIMSAIIDTQHAMEGDEKIDLFVSFSPATIEVGLFYADWIMTTIPEFESIYSLGSRLGSMIPLQNGTIGSLAAALADSSPGYDARRLASTASTKIDLEVYIEFHEKYLTIADAAVANMTYTIEPMSLAMVQKGDDNGGNSLGMAKVPQTWWSLVAEWQDEADGAAVEQDLNVVHDSISSLAAAKGLMLDFEFMNHASPSQDVLKSYGPSNLDTLKSVAASYDPGQVFQFLQNNGYLLRKV
ncbi:FAD-binding domain-containing protein [Xylariaceae sp. FL0016]|nr:FAD-binding domain-containing protein [Xylariaceae sp. FL0016]